MRAKYGSIISQLPEDIAEGVREGKRLCNAGLPTTEWHRHCFCEYQLLRCKVVPGAREKTRSYYHDRNPDAKVSPNKRRYP